MAIVKGIILAPAAQLPNGFAQAFTERESEERVLQDQLLDILADLANVVPRPRLEKIIGSGHGQIVDGIKIAVIGGQRAVESVFINQAAEAGGGVIPRQPLV